MADESIIIEVKDAVDSSISAKIRAIAQESRSAQKDLNSLQRQINGLNFNSIRTLSTTAVSAAAAINKLTASQSVLAAAQTKAAISAAQVSSAQEKAARASLQAATAAQQLATENNKTAKAQIDAQVSAMRLVAAQDRLKKSTENTANKNKELQTGVDKNAKSFERAGLSVKQYNASMRGVPAQITDIVVSLQGGQAPLTVLLQQGGQLKDMFGGIGPAARALSAALLAMINPFTVVAAAVGVFLFTVGKVESSLRELNGLAAQFSATGRGDIDNSFIVQLRKELALLPGVSKAAATEVIAEFAKIRDVGATNFKPAAGTVADLATALGTDAPKAAKILAESFKDPVKGAIDLDEKLGFLTVENFKTIKSLQDLGKTAEAQKFLIDKLKEAIGGLATDALTPMQKASNDLGNAWNKFTGELSNTGPIKAVNEFLTNLLNRLTDILNTLSNYKIPPWLEKMFSGGLNGMVADLVKGKTENTGGATGSWDAPARTAAQTRSTKSKTDAAGITGKKGTIDKTEENRATALAKINAQLENQLKIMQLLGPVAEKQQMFDSIQEGLIGRKIKLTDNETKSIKAKIAAIVDGALLQSETNRIYQDATAPLKTYETSLQAVANLLKVGAISESEHNKQVLLAVQAYEKTSAPLNEYYKALDDQMQLRKFLGAELQDETTRQNINNALLQKGIVLRKDELQPLMDAVKLNRELNLVHDAQNALLADGLGKRQAFITQLQAIKELEKNPDSGFTKGDAATATTGALGAMGIDTTLMQVQADSTVSIFATMYEQLDQLKAAQLISDADYFNAKSQLALQQKSVELGTSKSFYGELSNLQSSNIKGLAAIGKAAAITMATINTYEGATKALAQGGIYGTVMAAAVIASGLAQVASIRSQGFKTGGYTGSGGINEPMGVVHGKEFVFDAAATSRIGVSNLQALQDGSTSVASNSKVVGVPTGSQSGSNASNGQQSASNNIRVVNVLDPALIGDFLATPAGEQVFMNTIRKNSSGIKQTIQNG